MKPSFSLLHEVCRRANRRIGFGFATRYPNLLQEIVAGYNSDLRAGDPKSSLADRDSRPAGSGPGIDARDCCSVPDHAAVKEGRDHGMNGILQQHMLGFVALDAADHAQQRFGHQLEVQVVADKPAAGAFAQHPLTIAESCPRSLR